MGYYYRNLNVKYNPNRYPLTGDQFALLDLVRENPGLCTAELAKLRNDYSSYHSYLRDRLWTLERRGLVRSQEIRAGARQSVRKRLWFPAGE